MTWVYRIALVLVLLPCGCSRPAPVSQFDSAVKNNLILSGPFVLLPQSVAPKWRGGKITLYPNLPESEPTDYGRVVMITNAGGIGLVPAGDEHGLALGAEKMVLWPKQQAPDQLTFICVDACSFEANLDEIVDRSQQSAQAATGSTEWNVKGSQLVFLHANATIDDNTYGSTNFQVTPGKFIVTERKYASADSSEIARVVEIKRQAP